MSEKSLSKIRAVVFDFGGVIMSYSLVSRMIEEMSMKIGIPIEKFLEGKTQLWTRFEKCFELMSGEITAKEFEETIWIQAISQVYGIQVTEPIRWLTVKEKQQGVLNECMLLLLRDLRKNGYKTALLSNCFFMNARSVEPILPIDYSLYFDTVIESCQVGTHKPNRDIFELMHSRLGYLGIGEPDEVLFLDDLPEYCAAAEMIGWNTVQVKSPSEAVEKVRELLNLPTSELLKVEKNLGKIELEMKKTITEIGK
ncbi:unnamed protein product, partial [Mesorhabditis belari]|uniref:Uncharacterized protein n=1 Tax=Mesorhabditis belari TaxID=2138241 RepID=A0AAF3FTY9_9BILA